MYFCIWITQTRMNWKSGICDKTAGQHTLYSAESNLRVKT